MSDTMVDNLEDVWMLGDFEHPCCKGDCDTPAEVMVIWSKCCTNRQKFYYCKECYLTHMNQRNRARAKCRRCSGVRHMLHAGPIK